MGGAEPAAAEWSSERAPDRLRIAMSVPLQGSRVPSQPFFDVWEKNVPISGRSAVPPQSGHL
jgi:hypothetical protein